LFLVSFLRKRKMAGLVTGALGLLGFSSTGPVAGSFAAGWMSSIAVTNGVGVVAGSAFSTCQAAAMGSVAAQVTVATAAAAGAGSATAGGYSTYKVWNSEALQAGKDKISETARNVWNNENVVAARESVVNATVSTKDKVAETAANAWNHESAVSAREKLSETASNVWSSERVVAGRNKISAVTAAISERVSDKAAKLMESEKAQNAKAAVLQTATSFWNSGIMTSVKQRSRNAYEAWNGHNDWKVDDASDLASVATTMDVSATDDDNNNGVVETDDEKKDVEACSDASRQQLQSGVDTATADGAGDNVDNPDEGTSTAFSSSNSISETMLIGEAAVNISMDDNRVDTA
jgi:hypothetical protein